MSSLLSFSLLREKTTSSEEERKHLQLTDGSLGLFIGIKIKPQLASLSELQGKPLVWTQQDRKERESRWQAGNRRGNTHRSKRECDSGMKYIVWGWGQSSRTVVSVLTQTLSLQRNSRDLEQYSNTLLDGRYRMTFIWKHFNRTCKKKYSFWKNVPEWNHRVRAEHNKPEDFITSKSLFFEVTETGRL